jgi:stage II sporulation protein D
MGETSTKGSRFLEALKAQAVLSRTYALKNLRRHEEFDFCDTTHCQHYTGRPANPRDYRDAVDQTSGLVIKYKGQLCEVYYHSSCGGFTCDVNGVWDDNDIPYLRGIDDRNRCGISPHFRWKFQVEEQKLFEVLKSITGEIAVGLRIKDVDRGGWVKRIAVVLPGGREKIMRGEDFHIKMGRRLGWNTLKSANFTFRKSGNTWEFSGKGLGHGVGLCQYGARALAYKGKNFKEILGVYFPGVTLDFYL